MDDDRIKDYYRLCTVRLGQKSHIIDSLPSKKLEIIFTKKEMELYFRKHNGSYIAKDIVVGAGESNKNTQKYELNPILVFD